jgi:2-oxoglutarate-Fe(II)-dependent oxygenase superfamily protein
VLDLKISDVRRTPFPHVVKDDFVAPELYEALCRSFPECPANSGPTGYSYFWGDEAYTALIDRSAAWKSLFELTQSQTFVDYCMRQFADVFQEYRCTIDLSRTRYVAYCESRADKELRYLPHVEHEPHELWVRSDILQGRTGYSRRPHLDHRRRLVALLIYCCDADENRMEGGELVLHAPTRGAPSQAEDAVIRPRHNRMVAFACSNN